jgi:hypothetical protein
MNTEGEVMSAETQTIEERALQARATLRRAGFRFSLTREVPVAMLEALAGVVDEWGQDADYPDDHPEGVRG